MDLVAEILEKQAREANNFKSITVNKHLDLEYDLGTLLAVDSNELDLGLLHSKKDDYLQDLTRDNVQLLLNKIWELPTDRVDEIVVVKLPKPIFILPRSKPVPRPKPLTKWQEYAKLKGIEKKKKSKLSWDEQLQKWLPKYGYRRAQAAKDKDWLIEVPQNANPMEDQFAKKAEGKSERIAKNELQRLRNIAKAKNIKVPKMGVLNPDVSSAKDLQAAADIAKASTARGGLTANRKRKATHISSEEEKATNLSSVEHVLKKRPKIDIEKAVNRKINEDQVRQSTENVGKRKKGGSKSSSSKKPKGGKGQRKGKKSGKKRR